MKIMTKLVDIDKEKIKNFVGEKKAADLVLSDIEREKYPSEVKDFTISSNDSLVDLEIALRQCKRVGVFQVKG